ncbi:MAG: DNA repair protein RecN [Eubacterium sp.]|nr:DNA repair protein RecN [Eubacterium sp.]
MLKTLNIENIAVIEKADIEFSSGLNVMTGETGAGKSIVVDSINAVLGERTSKELVRTGAENAFVTALFEDINESVKNKLEELGINNEEDSSLLLTRKISASGKTSCRINGTPCTVSMLRELGSVLVNIHGQHDSQALLNPDYHYLFVDMLSDSDKPLKEYKESFRELIDIRKRLKLLTSDADEKERQLELLSYEIDELEKADIKIGEKEELLKKKDVILNYQNIISALNSVMSAMNGNDDFSGVTTLVAGASKELEALSGVDNELKLIYDSLTELNDSAETVKDLASSKLNSVDFSENELEKIEERLDLLYRFSRKYGETEEEMLSYLENAIKRRDSIVNSDEELEKLNAEYDGVFDKTVALANSLSENRKLTAKALEKDVKAQLEYLDMPKIQFVVSFEKGNLSSTGFDKIEFLISTNPGEPPKPLSKIASGGELSRIMLAIKNIIAKSDSVDTLIFDEIDTGVSGRASRKIGYRLRDVSRHTQVICVTHSAQIASVADTHLLISKEFKNERTYTSVQPLDYDERKKELARIMGGLEITDTLLKSAEELLKGN